MNNLNCILCLLTLAPSLLFADPLSIGTNTCLFLDDHFIAEQKGLTRTFHQGKPHPKAIVGEDKPWEHWITLWGSCFYDPVVKKYRMYYQTTLYPSNEPGISFRDYLLYAESTDGVNWVKPNLGLVEHDGSKSNNIVFAFAGPANIFLDPKATDPKGRIKGNIYFLKADPKYNNARSMALVQSGDGVNFEYVDFMEQPSFANPDQGNFVDIMIVGWDSLKNSYMAQFRTFSQHKVAEKPTGKRRALGISWSDRISRGWSPAIQTLKPDERDDAHATRLSKNPEKPDFTEFYTMPHYVYGNHYLGLITLFELGDGLDGNGGGGLHLAYSNDGLNWKRAEPLRNAIENGEDPELFPNFAQFTPPFDMGNETWIYYSENNGTHGKAGGFQGSRGRIRAGVWRKDGFASLSAADGTLITKPLSTTGRELIVNFQTEPGGTVRVGLMDADNKPITQFNLGECKIMKGDASGQKVVWSGGTDFSKLAGGKPVRLIFELNKAKLYSFRFAP